MHRVCACFGVLDWLTPLHCWPCCGGVPVQKTAKNDSNMDSVYTYLSLEQSDPTRLKELEDLTGKP